MNGYGSPAGVRKTNSLAIASLVLGVLGLTGIGPLGILALIFGYRARRRIERTGENGAGFATAGIVMGWTAVVLGIMVLIFILLASSGPMIVSGG